MTHHVVVNRCYGGFGVSEEAANILREQGVEVRDSGIGTYYIDGISRHDPRLVRVVQELGSRADSDYSALDLVEVTSDRYRIREYDGMESVETPDTIRWTVIE